MVFVLGKALQLAVETGKKAGRLTKKLAKKILLENFLVKELNLRKKRGKIKKEKNKRDKRGSINETEKKKKSSKSNRRGMMGIAFVVMVLLIALLVQSQNLIRKNQQYTERKEELEQELKDQEIRRKRLRI